MLGVVTFLPKVVFYSEMWEWEQRTGEQQPPWGSVVLGQSLGQLPVLVLQTMPLVDDHELELAEVQQCRMQWQCFSVVIVETYHATMALSVSTCWLVG